MPRRPLRRRWTPEDDEVLASLLREGKDYSEIARKMNRSSNALRLHTKKVAQSEPPAPTLTVELGLKARR